MVHGRVDERAGPGEDRPARRLPRLRRSREEDERQREPALVEQDAPEKPHSGTAKRIRKSGSALARESRRQAPSIRVLPSAKEKLAPAEVLGSSHRCSAPPALRPSRAKPAPPFPVWRTDPASKKTPKWRPSY